MAAQQIAIGGGAYSDATRPFSVQDCINYLPEVAEGEARSPGILRGAPGLTLLHDDLAGPVRGALNVEGLLFVVAGTVLYQVGLGVFTSRGTIPGSGRVSMAHNQITGGYQVTIANGSGGYVYNTATEVLTEITDEGFEGSIVAAFLDSYIIHIEPGRRYWFHSALANALSFNTINRYEAEASPDRLVTLIVDHRQLLVFNERTTEIYVNEPAGASVFQRASGQVLQKGCAGRFAVAQLDNSIIWLGHDGIFYTLDGYTPVRVSHHAIEAEIADKDWSACYATTWTDRGHQVAYFTFPDGKTWGYDVATRLWHRRETYGYDNWQAATLTYWNGQWIVGSAIDGKLYVMEWGVHVEGELPLVSRRVTAYVHNAQNAVFVDCLELVMAPGSGNTSLEFLVDEAGDSIITEDDEQILVGGIAADPVVNLRYSDDGGYNWTSWRKRSLGAEGEYLTRVRFWRLGRCRNRVFDIQCSSPNNRDLISASVKLTSPGHD